MRSTITLDEDTEALIQGLMRKRSLSFGEAVNWSRRRALTTARARAACTFPTYDLGALSVPTDHLLRLASDLQDEEIVRKSR